MNYPRPLNEEFVKKIVEEWDPAKTKPLVVIQNTVIVDGHHRWLAWLKLRHG